MTIEERKALEEWIEDRLWELEIERAAEKFGVSKEEIVRPPKRD